MGGLAGSAPTHTHTHSQTYTYHRGRARRPRPPRLRVYAPGSPGPGRLSLAVAWRTRPRPPESPLGRHVIHRQAAPDAKEGRGEEKENRRAREEVEAKAGPRIESPFPARATGGITQYAAAILAARGSARHARRSPYTQAWASAVSPRPVCTAKPRTGEPAGFQVKAVDGRRTVGKEGGALVVLQGGGPLWGFRPPPVTHFSAALSCRITTSLRSLDHPGARLDVKCI